MAANKSVSNSGSEAGVFSADTESLREENRRLRRDLERALEERNRLLKKVTTPEPKRAGGSSRVLEERLHTLRHDLDGRQRDIHSMEERIRFLEDRLTATGRIPAIFLSRLEELVISSEGNIPDTEKEIDNAADAPDKVANRFNIAIEALWRVLGEHKVNHNNQLKREIRKLKNRLHVAKTETLLLDQEKQRLAEHLEQAEETVKDMAGGNALRDEKLALLRRRTEDLEDENHRLAKASLQLKGQVKNLRRAVDPDMFRYIATDNAGFIDDSERFAPRNKMILLGAVPGLVLGAVLAWVVGDAMQQSVKLYPPHPTALPQAEAPPAPEALPDKPTLAATVPTSTQVERDLLADGSRGPELVALSSGTFTMGTDRYSAPENEKPARLQSVGAFAISRYEVTFDQYDAFAKQTDRPLPDDMGWGRGNHPVVNVSWQDAQAYTQWLSTQTGQRYRLPSEAEWEYAMAGGFKGIYWWGNKLQTNYEVCFNCGSPRDEPGSAVVGSAAANPFGLFDMGGNVMEWVDGCMTPDCALKVVRGGAFDKPASAVRTTARRGLESKTAYRSVGFRVLRERSAN